MMRFAFIICLGLTACKSRDDLSSAKMVIDAAPPPVSSFLVDGPIQTTWTYEDLKEFIQTHDLMGVDEVVEGLASADNGHQLLDQSVLVYAGTGDQHSSKEAPRVILFTPDASLILSYAGETYDGEPENLEIIQFRYDRQQFDFYEIVFSEEEGAQFFDGSAEETPKPDHCASCHMEDPRPIWDAAPLWPGVYGGLGDKIRPQTLEFDAASDLLNGAGTLPRYAHLSTIKHWFNLGIENSQTANGTFGTQTTKLNFRRMARLLTETPGHDTFKYALLSVLVGCDGDEPSLSMPTDNQFARSYAEILADTRTAIEEYHLDKVANLEALDESVDTVSSRAFRPTESSDELKTIAGIRYLLEERAANPMGVVHWSMTFSQSYSFAASQLGIRDFASYYFAHAFGEDKKMGSLHRDIASSVGNRFAKTVEEFASRIKTNKAAICSLLAKQTNSHPG